MNEHNDVKINPKSLSPSLQSLSHFSVAPQRIYNGVDDGKFHLHSLWIHIYVQILTLLWWEQQPQIILLKEGTDTSQGKAQLLSNINAVTAVGDVVRTTLGPRGMDKLIHDDKGSVTISNDGATIMKLLDIVHPAAKILVDIAKSQDSEVREIELDLGSLQCWWFC